MEHKLKYKRKLPHYQPRKGVFFITFRLNFPIPPKFLHAYNRYKHTLETTLGDSKDSKNTMLINNKKLFVYADKMYEICPSEINITENQQLAELIYDTIISMQESYFFLYIMTLMPNHVHMLIKIRETDGKESYINEIMQRIKGSTARKANQMLNRKGAFWYREYYDYFVRSQEELFKIFEYIRLNPVKAGIVNDPQDWKWTWINPEFLE